MPSTLWLKMCLGCIGGSMIELSPLGGVTVSLPRCVFVALESERYRREAANLHPSSLWQSNLNPSRAAYSGGINSTFMRVTFTLKLMFSIDNNLKRSIWTFSWSFLLMPERMLWCNPVGSLPGTSYNPKLCCSRPTKLQLLTQTLDPWLSRKAGSNAFKDQGSAQT